MGKIRNKIITISGEPVSGKSTVVKMLKEKYEAMGYRVHLVITGHVFRDAVRREYLRMYPDRNGANLADIQEDESFAERRAEIDGAIDSWIAKMGQEINTVERPNDVYIIDSRLAWHNIPDSYAVRLTVDEKIAGQRVFADQTRGAEDSYDTVEQAEEKTKQRKLGEIERYKKRYGVDLTNPDNYDLIVDTSYSNTAELADIIIKGEEEYRAGKYYPKTWASPVHFISMQRLNGECSDFKRQELTEMIKENGYDPIEGILHVAEDNGVKILLDGNHRTQAGLCNGKTLFPYEIIHKDDEIAKSRAKEVYENPTLETTYDWADVISYCGGYIGQIEFLQDFKVSKLLSAWKSPILRKRLGLDKDEQSR